MVKPAQRATTQESAPSTKPESRATASELKLVGSKPDPTQKRKNGAKKWASMTEEEKKKSRAYQKQWRANRRLASNKERLPFPFKFCPNCAGAMPTVTYNNSTFLRPCHFCPDCGYEIPIMPKRKVGGGKAK